jgi:hypothetical protein
MSEDLVRKKENEKKAKITRDLNKTLPLMSTPFKLFAEEVELQRRESAISMVKLRQKKLKEAIYAVEAVCIKRLLICFF